MKLIRGVLLDIDGTLVESNDAHAHAWVKALTENGRQASFETVRPLIGMGGDKLLPKVCGVDAESEEGKRISERRAVIFLKEYLPHLKPTRGAENLLQQLKKRGLLLAVAALPPVSTVVGCPTQTGMQDASRHTKPSSFEPHARPPGNAYGIPIGDKILVKRVKKKPVLKSSPLA